MALKLVRLWIVITIVYHIWGGDLARYDPRLRPTPPPDIEREPRTRSRSDRPRAPSGLAAGSGHGKARRGQKVQRDQNFKFNFLTGRLAIKQASWLAWLDRSKQWAFLACLKVCLVLYRNFGVIYKIKPPSHQFGQNAPPQP